MLDDLTDRRETKSYRAIYLENEFLKVIVLPELGGRVYSVYDKISKREVFYRNNVVKYGLVALRGAWISGGIEFNFPNGHTVVTVSPVASTLRQNPDGSATAVVGDVDWVTGMHWEVALTLAPGQALVEQRVTLFNATPLTHLYWYWANAAVPASEDMQIIYPMREAFPHVRGVVWDYPLHDGVDYSWYKNVRQPTSLFGRQVHRDFFGAYYHKADYGVVHVAGFRELPGKKYWTWGVAGDGLIWTDLLTDRDGPYNEIQSGRYQAQLNYEFIAPRRVESWTEYWYPVRGLGDGFVEATNQLALNVRFLPASGGEKPRVELRVCPVAEVPAAKIRVQPASQVPREFGPASLQALTPATFTIPVDDPEAERHKLVVDIATADGRALLHWSAADPVDGNLDFVPAAGAPRPAEVPPEKMSVEELFLSGVVQEKDGRESAARETFQRVLERDPRYIPALLKLAWQHYRAGDFQPAEDLIVRALARDVTHPSAFYLAGLIYRGSQLWTLAQDAFWAAIHFGGPPAPAFAQLGELAIRGKNYEEAVTLLRRALSYGPDDALVLADLAVALRLAGKLDEAAQAVDQALQKMPLFPMALAEQGRISEARGKPPASPEAAATAWAAVLPADVQNYLEIATWYRSLDDLASSDAVLQAALKILPAKALSPLVHYYLASNARRQGQGSRAEEYAAKALAAPYGGVFPNRLEDAVVLNEAVELNALDSHARYFLGNFLFAHGRYEDASHVWLQALGEGFEYSVLMRNLGLYAWRIKKDLSGATGFYGSAIRHDPNDYRLYVDLDELYFQLGDTAGREKLFAQAPAGVRERDTVLVRRALLLAQQKQYDQALELLVNHRFKPWEGGEIVREMFVLANLQKGREALEAKKLSDAEKAFRRALEYPVNLGVGKPDKPRDEEAFYWLGEALAAQGKTDAAREVWRQAAEEGKTGYGTSSLFRSLALRRLGQTEEANKILSALVQAAAKEKPGAEDLYLAGLLNLLENRKEQAKSQFQRALELNSSFWQARIELEQVSPAPLAGTH
jgi:tetratricopeptide (TPR) repeat protein